MATNKRYYWIKLKEEFFTDKRIKRLRRISGGDTYDNLPQTLLLSLKDEGKLYYDGVESDFIKELALTIDETDDDVMVTVNYLINQGLLEVVTENDEYYLTEIPNLIGSETASTRRSRKSRELKMLQCNTNATHKQQKCNGEIEIEKDIEIDKERGEIEKDKKSTPIFYGEFKNVRLSKEEYKNLKEKLNSHTDKMINKLSRYMESRGKTYQNHYATILNWYEKDKDKLRHQGLNKKMNYDVGESL
ncbi:phage replisome organizer N-terminal domain-containing protein [Streptococcus pyogenes]|uniref:phage replisome organizer N-terminal domain-containing protein n=1 Tax=Streptococcus pyogenes TaxID=1314 RepID=UPI00100DA31B|nr:phage replisome organizer N-terminal domain-containing protein [Streptococcus pyogenes]QAX69509.1 replisome organizer [Streptococcus pyogenes]